ncbi:MAG: hypothetical protein LBU75_16960 [Desulfovibrio sp.]|jgi:hypothetical protein|uniref:hypothetical protein n=1 Tax=Nitratidesulfovibrio liaohensis TaxID=2604158 RepID=UPI00141F8B43|nr:hypothetical protein [Nitratidesulfovibrio liaohensis]MDR3045929.1 hypothetical protein [Desulfovibrio sp.]NHZ46233.1 hypothetical protein [Nitratidesulfovibrio liaohensis]
MIEFTKKIAAVFAITAVMGSVLILGDLGTASAFNTMHGRSDVMLSMGGTVGTGAGYHGGHGGHGGCNW